MRTFFVTLDDKLSKNFAEEGLEQILKIVVVIFRDYWLNAGNVIWPEMAVYI